MDSTQQRVEEELNDLRLEIETFKKERKRVKAIVGQIGGVPSVNAKIFNIVSIVLIVVCLVGCLPIK